MSMTDEEVAAERNRFWEWRQRQPRGLGDSEIWLARSEIAHAERAELLGKMEQWDAMVEAATRQAVAKIVAEKDAEKAELVAERDRLRDRVRELANLVLNTAVVEAINMGVSSKRFWSAQEAVYLELAEEAGCWFDDNGNEVPLAEWRARQGGVG